MHCTYRRRIVLASKKLIASFAVIRDSIWGIARGLFELRQRTREADTLYAFFQIYETKMEHTFVSEAMRDGRADG